MSFKLDETVQSLKHPGRTGKIEGAVFNSSMFHVKWRDGFGVEWITQEFPKDIAKVKTVLEPGDKVCFKSDSSSVATVRDEHYHEGVVLLDWPDGAIGSANIDDLLLVQSNEPVSGKVTGYQRQTIKAQAEIYNERISYTAVTTGLFGTYIPTNYLTHKQAVRVIKAYADMKEDTIMNPNLAFKVMKRNARPIS